jgi:hypothetical protein
MQTTYPVHVSIDNTTTDPTASTAGSVPVVAVPEDRNLLLDEFSERLTSFKRLSKDDLSGANAILDEFGANGVAEQDIISELSKRKPLYLPGRFEEAHRLAMRSLEVLDRNGARSAKLPPLGFLQPVAAFGVQLVARFIVRNYQAEVINAIRNLYLRREAQCEPRSDERFIVRRARIDAERVTPTLKKNPVGVPAFLLGGAFLGSILSSIGRAAGSASSSRNGLIVLAVILFLVTAALSWLVFRGAAVARKRIRLTLDQPLQALWETIGAAGKPPKDASRQFALIATLLPGIGGLLLLIGIIIAVVR